MMEKTFRESMRWFGPSDEVSLRDIRQSGAAEIVTALHHIPNGAIWPTEDILKRKLEIEAAGLLWKVAESVPVHDEIKRRTGRYKQFVQNYIQTLKNLSECGIEVVTYNFMPVLDWTRTSLDYQLPNGAKALCFDMTDYIGFDLFILGRRAEQDYSETQILEAEKRFKKYSKNEVLKISRNIFAGLPGSVESHDLGGFRKQLENYRDIDQWALQHHLISFLEEIIPAAQEHNIKMALHPDDPPFALFGLPRIAGSFEDYSTICKAINSVENGICLCTGSLGVRSSKEVFKIISSYPERIHFAHLRNTIVTNEGSFYEAEHLQGDTDMYKVVHKLYNIAVDRKAPIPMRPDHGHQILDDLNKNGNPGYSCIGRLKGLSELRGLALAIENLHA